MYFRLAGVQKNKLMGKGPSQQIAVFALSPCIIVAYYRPYKNKICFIYLPLPARRFVHRMPSIFPLYILRLRHQACS